MSPEPICVLCNQAVINRHTIEGDLHSIECKICGKYESTDLDDLGFREFSERKKAMISAYTRELSKSPSSCI
ncbi:hypothetical protein LCGC14_1091580 [marine sediment metagenome]|uniref:Uncharacterized protein n=1 Tax=marine sediment metagenome TaxID=412755 RepID=A0A0F9MZX6_9ZZZZ